MDEINDVKSFMEGKDVKNEELVKTNKSVVFDDYFGDLENSQLNITKATVSEYESIVWVEFNDIFRGVVEAYVMDKLDMNPEEVINDREFLRTFIIDAVEYSEGIKPKTDNVQVQVQSAPPRSVMFKVVN